jgi:death-on-curing protein
MQEIARQAIREHVEGYSRAELGADAYPDLDAKAAALLHCVARNHALVDGNERLSLAAVIAFYGLNGRRLMLTNDAAYDLIIRVASGELDSVQDIAAILAAAKRPRS